MISKIMLWFKKDKPKRNIVIEHFNYNTYSRCIMNPLLPPRGNIYHIMCIIFCNTDAESFTLISDYDCPGRLYFIFEEIPKDIMGILKAVMPLSVCYSVHESINIGDIL